MQTTRFHVILSRLVAYVVLAYGVFTVGSSLLRQVHIHGRHDYDAILVSLPLLIGLSYVYLATLLLRLKFNAWLTAVALSFGSACLYAFELLRHGNELHYGPGWWRIILAVGILAMLLTSRHMFRVRSDRLSFLQALRVSALVLFIALIYGVSGFCLLDQRDFHREINLPTALHQTIDQFGLTTQTVTPDTRRAVLFVDSLSAISIGALAYVALSFFQPLRLRLENQTRQRKLAEELLQTHNGDIDDYFKLWPHDKHYYFDPTHSAGVAYHVNQGVALVVADPFGEPRKFRKLLEGFQELCFVNDWTAAFIHIGDKHAGLYKKLGYRLQKIGEEAVLDLNAFQAERNGKYFRQIRNRFTKLGYTVELVQPPHSDALVRGLRQLSQEWLSRPGRAERGFMMGYFSTEYVQSGPLAVVYDAEHKPQGFLNLVPTYIPGTANYDMLRCGNDAPGNCNDFLLLGLIDILHAQGVHTLNLGLCPLSGLDEKITDASLIDTALRFVYANGDRFYSFSGLKRFKAKYNPQWQNRYVAYRGGVAGFSRSMAALTRAMKIK